MNFAYFRKSTKPAKDIAGELEKSLRASGYSVSTSALPSTTAFVITAHKLSLTQDIVTADHTIIGLVPSSLLIMEKDGATLVGVSNPKLLMGVTPDKAVQEAALTLDRELRGQIDAASGVGVPVISKIKVYATQNCPYCKMEKEYLDAKKVAYESVMVDTDRAAAEAMVRATGQTGVPVTEIIYNDADPEYIIGFDKERIAEIIPLS